MDQYQYVISLAMERERESESALSEYRNLMKTVQFGDQFLVLTFVLHSPVQQEKPSATHHILTLAGAMLQFLTGCTFELNIYCSNTVLNVNSV